MDALKTYWKSKTIYRKITLILIVFHFLGFFIIPLATLYASASTLNKWMGYLGVGEFPKNLTYFNLIRLINAFGGSDSIFYSLTILACVGILVIQLLGKKRGSYVATLIIWGIFSIFEYPAIDAADTIQVYEFTPISLLMLFSAVAINVAAILGIILEMRAQAKMAQKAAMAPVGNDGDAAGSASFNIDPEKMEKFKEQAGNFADTTAAVAKKAAKAAVQGVYKATDAVKGFVEEAKNESNAGKAQQASQQGSQQNVQYQQAPVQQVPQQNVQYQQAPVQQVPQQNVQYQQAPVQQAAPQPTTIQQVMQMQEAAAQPQVMDEEDDMKTVVLSQAAPKVKEEVPQPRQIPQTGTITGIKGMFTGAQIPLASGEELIIGRSADICHIILEGVEISRKHCVVMYDGTTGNYLVTDSSGNGTFTGDGGRLPVNRVTALTPGSIICIGSDANAFKLG